MSSFTSHILLVAAMFWVSSGALRAQLSGSDNFNDNSKDTTRWGTDDITGGASLTEANGRLEYRVGTADTVNGYDEAQRSWILNTAGNNDAFDVIVDVFNNVNPTGSNNVSVGFSVISLENADDSVYVELYRGGPSGDGKGFLSALSTSAVNFWGDHEVLDASNNYTNPTNHPAVTTGAVRMSYNPDAQVFTAYYDADGSSNGYQWQVYGSFGVAGSGGTTRNGNWQLTQNRGFKVSVAGFSEGQVVASGAVYADNFAARTLALSALSLSAGALSPSFDSGTTKYLSCVSNDTTSITVTPATTFSNATLTVNGNPVASGSASASIPLRVGANLISIGIASQDGALTNTYTVNVIRHGTTVLTGTDNFNDNTRDTTKWAGADDLSGGASLSEVNGRLEYQVATPDLDSDGGQRTWTLNTAGSFDAFDVVLDVVNTLSPTGFKAGSTTTYKNASVGISVTSLENADDSIFVELYRGDPGPTADGRGFLAALSTTVVNAEGDHEVLPRTTPSNNPAVTTGSVRLTYDPVLQVFTSYYDPDGSSNGYQWQVYGTFGVGPSGGGTMRNGQWQLTHNLGFQVSVGAFSEGLAVASGTVSADNFAVSTSAPLPGAPDITFNGTGHATTEAGDSEGSDMGMVQQCDGKIIIATSTDHGIVDGTRDVLLRRFNADGSVDDAFNTAVSAIAQDVYVLNVALQQDGKILVVGSSGGDLALLRYDTNGNLDTTFDGDGKVITNLGGSDDEGTGLIVAPDGKVLVVGTDGNNVVVVRYNTGGGLDTSFGGTGVVVTDFGGFEFGNSVAVQSDGGVVVSGDSEGNHMGGGVLGFVLARFHPNGTLDTGFGSNGKVVTTAIGGERGCAWQMKLDSDNKIVIGGRTVNAIGQMALVRYTSNGSLDTTLDGTGIVTTGFGGSFAEGNGLAFQSNQKILVAGNATLDGESQFALARFNLDGSLDTGFHADGRVTSYLCSSDAFASGVVVQGDGRIVVGGWFQNSSGAYDVALVRYEGDPVAYEVQYVVVSKSVEHVQDSASHVIPNPTPPSETYGGPFGFSVNVQGLNINALRESPTVTGPFTAYHLSEFPPGALRTHNGGRLVYDCNDESWRYGWPHANDWGSPSLADLDARFGSGVYTVNVDGTDVALNLTGDAYPTVPVMTLSGGIWSGGKYYIAPEQALVITSNTFTAYGTHTEDFVDAWIDGVVEPPTVFASTSPGANSVNLQVPANTFVSGQQYNAGVEFGAVVDINDSVLAGATNAAYYSMSTGLTIAAMTSQQRWRWTNFGAVENSGNAADTFDADRDGLPNLLEWACNLNPASASKLPAGGVRNGANFEFTYTRSVAALNAGASFIVEWSDTLLGNSWSPAGVTENVLSDNGTVQQVKATIPAGSGGRRFAHLKVMAPP